MRTVAWCKSITWFYEISITKHFWASNKKTRKLENRFLMKNMSSFRLGSQVSNPNLEIRDRFLTKIRKSILSQRNIWELVSEPSGALPSDSYDHSISDFNLEHQTGRFRNQRAYRCGGPATRMCTVAENFQKLLQMAGDGSMTISFRSHMPTKPP